MMNGIRKFHKANGPAFNVGEEWVSISGKIRCHIVSVRCFGSGKWDYEVTYRYQDGAEHTKDAWNFQVRYEHVADLAVA
jgi:hypothetical protein